MQFVVRQSVHDKLKKVEFVLKSQIDGSGYCSALNPEIWQDPYYRLNPTAIKLAISWSKCHWTLLHLH